MRNGTQKPPQQQKKAKRKSNVLQINSLDNINITRAHKHTKPTVQEHRKQQRKMLNK